jgi:DNA-binding NtrC family response regulator
MEEDDPDPHAVRGAAIGSALAGNLSGGRDDAGDGLSGWEKLLLRDAWPVNPATPTHSWGRPANRPGSRPVSRPVSPPGGWSTADASREDSERQAELRAAARDIFSRVTIPLAGIGASLRLVDKAGAILADSGASAASAPFGAAPAREAVAPGGARATVRDPDTRQALGALDLSGPAHRFAVTVLAMVLAREVEGEIAASRARIRTELMGAALAAITAGDPAEAVIVLDRLGRVVHASGRLPKPLEMGQFLPGAAAAVPPRDWDQHGSRHLPDWLGPAQCRLVKRQGMTIGAIVLSGAAAPAGGGGRARGRARPKAAAAAAATASFEQIVGASAAMRAAIARARMLATRMVPVLIEGETGVGKGLFAHAIHAEWNARAPLITVNCGALPKELLAAELFGHTGGAFTGATREGRPGRFELADGGILCLDEIGELPLDQQPYLLSALEENVIYRLGDTTPRRVRVRLLALTNRNLAQEVAAGRFRRDLFHRISVTRLSVPALRERRDDIPLLAMHFSREIAQRHGISPPVLQADAFAALDGYDWPGNARELRNLIEGLMLTGDGGAVTAGAVRGALARDVDALSLAGPIPSPMHSPSPNPSPNPNPNPSPSPSPSSGPSLAASAVAATREAAPPPEPVPSPPLDLMDSERAAIERALRAHRGNFAQAARALGISRSTLYRKAILFGLSRITAPE